MKFKGFKDADVKTANVDNLEIKLLQICLEDINMDEDIISFNEDFLRYLFSLGLLILIILLIVIIVVISKI